MAASTSIHSYFLSDTLTAYGHSILISHSHFVYFQRVSVLCNEEGGPTVWVSNPHRKHAGSSDAHVCLLTIRCLANTRLRKAFSSKRVLETEGDNACCTSKKCKREIRRASPHCILPLLDAISKCVDGQPMEVDIVKLNDLRNGR